MLDMTLSLSYFPMVVILLSVHISLNMGIQLSSLLSLVLHYEKVILGQKPLQLFFPQLFTQRCVQCNGNPNTCETVGTDGPGVNTDFILYVGAIACTNSGTLAFATACQLESSLDR